MNSQPFLDSNGTMLKRLAIQHKFMAFLISSGAIFSAMVVGWSWTITGYQTMSEITIQSLDQPIDRQEFQVLLANTFRTKVTDSLLSDLLAKTKEETPLQSRFLRGDTETLRKAILVKTLPESTQLKIQFSLMGIGTTDERVFLRDFTAKFSEELTQLAKAGSGSAQFVVQNAELARYLQIVDELDRAAQQLERKIGEVEKICGTADVESGPFRIVSHRKGSRDLSREDVRQLQEKLSNIDIGFVRESSGELKSLLDSMATSGQSYALPQVHPIGTPQPKQLFVLSILAAAFGMVVANHFRPFATRGFTSIAEVSHKLGIPVVAAMPINQVHRIRSLSERINDRKLPWANQLTRFAAGWLLAVGVLAIGFCCINQEIREVFLRNPVDGFARVFWCFKR